MVDNVSNSKLQEIIQQAKSSILNTKNIHDLNNVKSFYLGSQGIVNKLLKDIVKLPVAERKDFGSQVNFVKTCIEEEVYKQKKHLEDIDLRTKGLSVDITLAGRNTGSGHIHPVMQFARRAIELLARQGFCVADGPEIDSDYYNFTALNISNSHPARDMHDTFYLTDTLLLRTHTSNVQIRALQDQEPPCAIIVPGKVYRRDLDATHTPMFHQLECVLVDRGVNIAQLKWVISNWLQEVFSKKLVFRFRPSYFPFTEPSLEVDMSCVLCNGDGCRVCKHSGWLEVMGSGLMHPDILRRCGINTDIYSGFAFGCGLDRLAMLFYKINDLRLMFSGDLQFLQQF